MKEISASKECEVVICVTRQRSCERLIREGSRIAKGKRAHTHVIHVVRPGENFLGNPKEGEALDYLFQISKNVGAQMTVMRSENVIDTLVDFAKKQNVTMMVLGESPDNKNSNNIVLRLEQSLPQVEFVVVPA